MSFHSFRNKNFQISMKDVTAPTASGSGDIAASASCSAEPLITLQASAASPPQGRYRHHRNSHRKALEASPPRRPFQRIHKSACLAVEALRPVLPLPHRLISPSKALRP